MDKKKVIIALGLILAIAIFFRTWHLNSIPPGVYPDEAMNGNNAIEANKTGEYKLFYPENNGREGLFINLIALSFKIFGVHIWSLKLISALIGILTVLGLYLLTKELFRVVLRNYPRGSAIKTSLNSSEQEATIIALLATFFLAVSFWHVNFSRISFRAIMVPFCLVWSFYFLTKAMNIMRIYLPRRQAGEFNTNATNDANKRNILLSVVCYLLSGFFFGLGFHTYIAFRMAVIILIVPIVIIIVKFFKRYKSSSRFWYIYFNKGFWQFDIWLLVIILVALPIGLYFLHNPQDFIGRAGGVSIFAQKNPLKALAESTIKTLGMFNFVGDKNWRHNYASSPQLFWPVGALFIMGLIISIKELINSIKQKNCLLLSIYCLLFTWFFVMLLPAILTIEGLPHALRTIGVIPVCYIFAALGFIWLWGKLKQIYISKKLKLFTAYCLLFTMMLVIAYAQYDKYFVDWTRQLAVENAFAKPYVEIGEYLNNLSPEISSYVIVNQSGVLVPINQNGKIKNIPMPAQTVMFIQEIPRQARDRQTIYLLPEEINEIKTANQLVVIPLQYDQEIFRKLKEKFPQGNVKSRENFSLFEL